MNENTKRVRINCENADIASIADIGHILDNYENC